VPETVTPESRADEAGQETIAPEVKHVSIQGVGATAGTAVPAVTPEKLQADVQDVEAKAKPVVIKLEHAIAAIDKFQVENPGIRSWVVEGLKDALTAIEHHES
jgi:hypothetical protein